GLRDRGGAGGGRRVHGPLTAAGPGARGGKAMSRLLLKMEGIVKRFPGVVALKGVDFELKAGEVHALLGENGAGKSTLMKIISGALAPDEGRIYLDGQATAIASPQHAQALGISTVHQEP